MKAITLDEFKPIFKSQNYRHLGLFDIKGEQIIAFNNPRTTGAQRLKQIEVRLEALQENLYVIKCKNAVSKSTKTDDYYIAKNIDMVQQDQIKTIVVKEKGNSSSDQNENLRSLESALEDRVKIKEQEIEIENLKSKIELLESEINRLEDEPDQLADKVPMEERIKGWVENLSGLLTPVIEKHYDLKERKLRIEEAKVKMDEVKSTPEEKQPEYDTSSVDLVSQRIIAFINDIKDASTHQMLVDLYNNSSDLHAFFEGLQSKNIDVFIDLQNYINNGERVEA